MNQKLIFHQLFEKDTSTFTYILGDADSKEAIIIDPVMEMVQRDLQLLSDLDLNLKYIFDTHVHADHITASGELRKRTGAKIGISSAYDMACPDLHIEDGQEIQFGCYTLKAIHTPGHTSGCLSYQIENMVFTGDALLIRGCGRTDFQEGSAERLFISVREKLFSLPDETVIFPAHDYKGFSQTSIGLEKKLNPRLNLNASKDDFIHAMANLNLAHPKKIQEAVPANILCGLPATSSFPNIDLNQEITLVTPETLHAQMGYFKVIDVRGADEFNNELGHIPNAELATLGHALEVKLHSENKNQDVIFVCRSGKRSGEATRIARSLGFHKVFSLDGGMLRWHELRFPFQRDRGGS